MAPDFSSYYQHIEDAAGNRTLIEENLNKTFTGVLTWVCNNLKVKVAEPDDPTQELAYLNSIYASFSTVFVYFFTFAGAFLVLLAVLFLLGKRRKLRGELLAVCVRAICGVVISCLAIMAVPSVAEREGSAYTAYMFSAWMLPTVLIVYLLVIVVDNLLIRYVHSVVKWRAHLHRKGLEA